jgi:hypothetical protein
MRSAKLAVQLSRGRDVQYAVALALAFANDTRSSKAPADDLVGVSQRIQLSNFITFQRLTHSLRLLIAKVAKHCRTLNLPALTSWATPRSKTGICIPSMFEASDFLPQSGGGGHC